MCVPNKLEAVTVDNSSMLTLTESKSFPIRCTNSVPYIQAKSASDFFNNFRNFFNHRPATDSVVTQRRNKRIIFYQRFLGLNNIQLGFSDIRYFVKQIIKLNVLLLIYGRIYLKSGSLYD